MSTGNVNLDILLGQIEADRIGNTKQSIAQIMNRYPSLSQEQAQVDDVFTHLIFNKIVQEI